MPCNSVHPLHPRILAHLTIQEAMSCQWQQQRKYMQKMMEMCSTELDLDGRQPQHEMVMIRDPMRCNSLHSALLNGAFLYPKHSQSYAYTNYVL